MRCQVMSACRYGDEVGSITVTGHSLGGALASICAFDLAYSEINQVGARPDGALIPVTAITFCGAAVGAQRLAFMHLISLQGSAA